VKLIREWLDTNQLKYPCLADFTGVDATFFSENSMTKPTSKDGMPLPLPCCVDRVGTMALSDTVSGDTDVIIIGNNSHEPLPVSVSVQPNFNWESSHFFTDNKCS